MKLSKESIARMAEAYKGATTQHVAERAVTKNGILAASEDIQVAKGLSNPAFAFSIDVDDEAVANQKQSGRCWMFACLNFCRFHVEKELDLPRGTFELSQAYLAFYNKLERSNWFLDHIVATADKGLDDREVTWLVNAPMQDGGDWDMVCGLIEKYGVVPHAAMVETACTNDTAQINTVLSHLLRQDALKLRSMVREGAADADVEAAEEAMLTEVYRVLCVAFGEPPQKVDFEYTDSKKEFHGVYGLTPLEFYRRYVGIDLDDYVGVINVPGEGNPYGRTGPRAREPLPQRRHAHPQGRGHRPAQGRRARVVRLRRASALRRAARRHEPRPLRLRRPLRRRVLHGQGRALRHAPEPAHPCYDHRWCGHQGGQA